MRERIILLIFSYQKNRIYSKTDSNCLSFCSLKTEILRNYGEDDGSGKSISVFCQTDLISQFVINSPIFSSYDQMINNVSLCFRLAQRWWWIPRMRIATCSDSPAPSVRSSIHPRPSSPSASTARRRRPSSSSTRLSYTYSSNKKQSNPCRPFFLKTVAGGVYILYLPPESTVGSYDIFFKPHNLT